MSVVYIKLRMVILRFGKLNGNYLRLPHTYFLSIVFLNKSYIFSNVSKITVPFQIQLRNVIPLFG